MLFEGADSMISRSQRLAVQGIHHGGVNFVGPVDVRGQPWPDQTMEKSPYIPSDEHITWKWSSHPVRKG